MNAISWFVYAAGVSTLLHIVLFISMIGLVILYASWWEKYFTFRRSEEDIVTRPPAAILWLAVACAALFCFIPGSATFYLIAASELSQVDTTSETGRYLLDRVQAALDLYLETGEEE